MTSVDMLVKDGTVVTPNGSFNASLVVDEGKIVAIKVLDDGIQADTVIDASGKHVLPGVIDAHAFAAFDDQRPAVAEARKLRIRMDEGFDVAGLEIGKRHDLTLVGAAPPGRAARGGG